MLSYSPLVLNPGQIAAIKHVEGPLLILAGAGSGKTRVIIERTKNLINQGVAPEKILCLTFTKKAAREMKERILKIKIGRQQKNLHLNKMLITTFHSFSLALLKNYFHKLESSASNTTKSFTICDQNDQYEALLHVLKELKIDFSSTELNNFKEAISRAKNDLQQPQDCEQPLLKKIWIKYQTFLKNRKMIDFDDLLQLSVKLLTDHPEISKRLKKKYHYLMVDEYQDTNLAQYKILTLIVNQERNLMVVGDDDQSIYSWRGARIENILDFEKDFLNCKVIRLEKNYRSTQHIVNAALGLIKKNQYRKDKKCFSDNPPGIPLLLIEAKGVKEEASAIVEHIQSKMVRENFGPRNTVHPQQRRISYADFAVLYRTKQQSKPIQEMLYQEKIPYRVWGDINFFERKEIRDLLSYIKLLVNPDDDLSFLRIANKPKRFREKTLKALQSKATELQVSVFHLLRSTSQPTDQTTSLDTNKPLDLNPQEKQAAEILIELVDRSRKSTFILNRKETDRLPEDPVLDLEESIFSFDDDPKPSKQLNLIQLLKEFIDLTDYESVIHLANEKPELKEKRFKNLNRFYDYLDHYRKKSKNPNLENFLLHLNFSLSEENEQADLAPMVHLMTIHSAKGLEFPFIYIIGLEENILPFKKDDEIINLEEERRLFYVAITRAQRECVLSLCQERKSYGEVVQNSPSRFLNEIPKEHLVLKKELKSAPADQNDQTSDIIKNNALKKIKSILNQK